MASVDLRFAEGPASTDLVFGESGGPPPVFHPLGGAAILPPAAFSGVISLAAPVVTTASLAGPVPLLALRYDNAVNRAPFRWAASAWQAASERLTDCSARHRATAAHEAGLACGLRAGSPRRGRYGAPWQAMQAARRPAVATGWSDATGRGRLALATFVNLSPRQRPERPLLFAAALARDIVSVTGWQERLRRPRPSLSLSWGAGYPQGAVSVIGFEVGTAQRLSRRIPWQCGRVPLPGKSSIGVDPPAPPIFHGDPHLLFDDSLPVSVGLVFGRAHVARIVARVVIPFLRSYLVVNDVTLLRVSNGLALQALSLSLSIDSDSWCWGWQASLPGSALENVLPIAPGEPVEFEATVNGVVFRLLGERVARDRRFAQARITVGGRGLAAALGAPYAAPVSRGNPFDRTAQQLMADALTLSGVSIGWDLDWQITDWLVPSGVWSHVGTHIEAVTRIAEAAGAYVQASRHEQVLAILPRYPVAPWGWSGVTPDYSLPAAVTTAEQIEWLERPAYNAVYVSGESAGILGYVRRAGTAGDLVAPMAVDSLLTHVDAARQRGLPILSDTGPQQLLTLDTPVLSGVGIYPVGSFVEFTDGADIRLGIVRSIEVSAALPKVRQRIVVECHG